MKEKDVKILWGRSGNRCAFCKIELTPDGAETTLGEMAHIVAKSPNGPRGQSNLTSEERDEYSNLILLCPTHHTVIDSNPQEWTVEQLKQIKTEHESWVSNQLNQGRIAVNKIDNSAFLKNREEELLSFAGKYVWITVSLTPLNIADDIIDPLNSELLASIHSLRLPSYYEEYTRISSSINQRDTRPNEYGVINEQLRHIKHGFAHRIQVFRNCHFEFMVCLEGIKSSPNAPLNVLVYQDIAQSFITQTQGLMNIWNRCISLDDMLLTAIMTNTFNVRLYSGRQTWTGYELGEPVNFPILKYSKVINKNDNLELIQESVIKRFVNYFGLNINSVFAQERKLNKPSKLY